MINMRSTAATRRAAGGHAGLFVKNGSNSTRTPLGDVDEKGRMSKPRNFQAVQRAWRDGMGFGRRQSHRKELSMKTSAPESADQVLRGMAADS